MNTDNIIEKDKECIICFDIIDNKQDIHFFKDCEHFINYHSDCINDWINECTNKNIIPSCPICRKDLELINNYISLPETDQIIYVYNNQIQTENNVYSFYYYTIKCCSICTIIILSSIFIVCLDSLTKMN